MFLLCVLDGSLLRFLKILCLIIFYCICLNFSCLTAFYGCYLFFSCELYFVVGGCFCVFGGLRPLIDRADYAAFYCCDILSLFYLISFACCFIEQRILFFAEFCVRFLLSGAAFALRVIVRVLALELAGALK